MKDSDWRELLKVCRTDLGPGSWDAASSSLWCAYTTFSSLENDINYWKCGFPNVDNLGASSTVDGGLWRQSFYYQDIAHLIVPAKFSWETYREGEFATGRNIQDIGCLSQTLSEFRPSPALVGA